MGSFGAHTEIGDPFFLSAGRLCPRGERAGAGVSDQPNERTKKKKKCEEKERGCNTRTSQEVTHPSTTLAQTRLTAEF